MNNRLLSSREWDAVQLNIVFFCVLSRNYCRSGPRFNDNPQMGKKTFTLKLSARVFCAAFYVCMYLGSCDDVNTYNLDHMQRMTRTCNEICHSKSLNIFPFRVVEIFKRFQRHHSSCTVLRRMIEKNNGMQSDCSLFVSNEM